MIFSTPPRCAVALALIAAAAASPRLAQHTSTAATDSIGVRPAGTTHEAMVPRAMSARRGGAIVLDGRLDEPTWAAAQPVTRFTQIDPRDGEPSTERTDVRFVYDDDALYVGARMYDSRGAAGVTARLARRDADTESDWFQIVLDTYHDHLSRAFFQVNPVGVKMDAIGIAGSGVDDSWDPVWAVATRVDSAGWVAELRIPYSQLRFRPGANAQTWGLQVRRFIARLNEESQWSYWTKRESGGPPRFGHLDGLQIAPQPHHLEVAPYVTGRQSYAASSPGDPFHDGSQGTFRAGGDLKYLLTNDLTLDATINPDFGQVEVDPAVINLSAFETFYPERRPFFVAGSGIFDYGSFSCFFCSNASSLDAFYSRRIGRQPHLAGYVDNNSRYRDVPENSTILGAAKLTGRVGGNTTIGVLDGVTRSERARFVPDSGMPRERVEVEPLSNYFVARAKRAFDANGNFTLGAIATSVARRLDEPLLAARLARHAEVAGGDVVVAWHQQTYSFMASGLVSSVVGDSGAIRRAQYSSARYFQRPDRKGGRNGLFSDALDPTTNALRGYGFYSRIAKDAGDWLMETAVNVRSPGFETNDLSFLTRADYIWQVANVMRQWTRPTRYYRDLNVTVGMQNQVNYDGDLTDRDYHVHAGVSLPSFWSLSGFYMHRPVLLDDQLTRGGPVVRRVGYHFGRLTASSDARKPVVGSAQVSVQRPAGESGPGTFTVNTTVRFKPRSNVSFSIGPSFSHSASLQQYVAAIDSSPAPGFYGERYVFSTLEQRTLSLETRLNVTFTPTLTLELFAYPLLGSGDYYDFKEFAAPRALTKLVYGKSLGAITPVVDTTGAVTSYVVDDGRPGSRPFSFANPDFNSRSLNGDAVLRWEYRPGSTLYLVWTQSRSGDSSTGDFDLTRDWTALSRTHPDNIFAVKVSYWLGR